MTQKSDVASLSEGEEESQKSLSAEHRPVSTDHHTEIETPLFLFPEQG